MKPLSARELREVGIPAIYLNMVGGQDELVFDGGSFVMDADGQVTQRAPSFEEMLACGDLNAGPSGVLPARAASRRLCRRGERLRGAGVRNARLRRKNGFPGIILGLSGGVDSALTVAIACDALGADKVRAIMMPFKYTAHEPGRCAGAGETLGVQYDVLPICTDLRRRDWSARHGARRSDGDVTEENIQARCRGILLMAFRTRPGACC